MTKPKDPEDLRTCTRSNAGCLAPAGYGISGVGYAPGDKGCRGTCYGCGEPVCANPECSKRMVWRGLIGRMSPVRRRICAHCQSEVRPLPTQKSA